MLYSLFILLLVAIPAYYHGYYWAEYEIKCLEKDILVEKARSEEWKKIAEDSLKIINVLERTLSE